MPPVKSITIKQGDTGPVSFQASHAGTDPPFQGATSLKLYARELDADVNEVDGVAISGFNDDGSFEWTPAAAGVDTPGTYRVYVRATFPSSREERFPSSGYFKLVIEENFE